MSHESRRFEKARVGFVGDIEIVVCSGDYPPHFYAIRTGLFEAQISIGSLEVISYSWQNDGSCFSAEDLEAIKVWLDIPCGKSNISNKDAIELFWEAINQI